MFTFRLRFNLPDRVKIEVPAPASSVSMVLDARDLLLARLEGGAWVARTDGFSTESEATSHGERVRDALSRALAKLGMAADFGDRQGLSRFYDSALRELGSTDRPLRNDVQGLDVYETEPRPRFAYVGGATVVLSQNADRVEQAIVAAWSSEDRLTERERVSFDVYSASFLAKGPDIRLLLLVMAIEILAEEQSRPANVAGVVDALLGALDAAKGVLGDDYQSMRSSLDRLRSESIGQACRRVVARLGDRKYDGHKPLKLFSRAYGLRSKLTHGELPRPARAEVGRVAAHLQVLVGDLLAGSLRELTI